MSTTQEIISALPLSDTMRILTHSLGMKTTNYRRKLEWWLDDDNHRNGYATHPGHHGYESVLTLVACGLMTEGTPLSDTRPKYRWFYVTPKGVKFAKERFYKWSHGIKP